MRLEFRNGNAMSQDLAGVDGHTYRVRRETVETALWEAQYLSKPAPKVADFTDAYGYALYDVTQDRYVTPYLGIAGILAVLERRGIALEGI